jgi:uncharacterized membrane protein YhaH (DUF805 family)
VGRYNPFSFKGEIGRALFWLFTFIAQVVALPIEMLPVSVHEIRLNPPHGIGEETLSYATPLQPVTPENLTWLALYYLLIALAFWIMLAAIVRRMRDLERSVKWLLAVLALLVTHTTLEALFSRPDAPFSVFEIANLALLAPAVALGAYGLFEMYLFRGNSFLPKRTVDDLREAQL